MEALPAVRSSDAPLVLGRRVAASHPLADSQALPTPAQPIVLHVLCTIGLAALWWRLWRGVGVAREAPPRRTGLRRTGSPRRSPHAFGLRLLLVALAMPGKAEAAVIQDYQDHLNPGFKKRQRQDTRFILIHSTECGLRSALRTLSRGKVRRGRPVTRGGHAHYLLARRGNVYRILDPKYRADHAGVSMWNGVESLSDHSLGIELEGFHDIPFTTAQYRSLRWLVKVLRRRFDIASRDVLEHFRVAYTPPNRFFSRNWRGRKRDPGLGNFDRRRAGLLDEYVLDPDVLAGRVGSDVAPRPPPRATAVALHHPGPCRPAAGIITRRRSAWNIARAKYRDPNTLYLLPDKTVRRGSEIRDWRRIPSGTRVCLGSPESAAGVLSRGRGAWTIAREAYDAQSTIYAMPGGTTRRGHEIGDWSRLPGGTRVFLNVP